MYVRIHIFFLGTKKLRTGFLASLRTEQRSYLESWGPKQVGPKGAEGGRRVEHAACAPFVANLVTIVVRMLLVVRPGAPFVASFAPFVAMPGAPRSFLFLVPSSKNSTSSLVAMPFAPTHLIQGQLFCNLAGRLIVAPCFWQEGRSLLP